jgi:hypothetical protein
LRVQATITNLLSSVPRGDFTDEVLRPGRKLESELKPEESVHVMHEVEKGSNLVLNLEKGMRRQGGSLEKKASYLAGHAEDMGVVLHEPTDTSETGQSTRGLVAVDDAELGHANRQLLVATIPRVEDQGMARAIHGLERPLLLLDVEGEHVIVVVLPVTRRLPKLAVVHIWRDD